MEIVPILGSLSLLFASGIALYGFPAQIYKNYREKRCGFALPYVLLIIGNLVTRIAYGAAINSPYLVIPDTLGLVFVVIILYQFILYGRNQKQELLK